MHGSARCVLYDRGDRWPTGDARAGCGIDVELYASMRGSRLVAIL